MVPNLLEWYDIEKNINIDTTKLSVSSIDNVWWKCPVCAYNWSSSPSARVIFNNGKYGIRDCAVCSGSKRNLTYVEEFPDLAINFIKNLNGCSLEDIKGSTVKERFWWYCDKCNEEFESTVDYMIRSRNTSSKGCPYCAGKKVKRENSFASRHPEVMDEYDPSNDIDPFTVTEYSTKSAKWICRNDNSHKWEAPFESRSNGQGSCKICRGYQYGKMFFEEHSEFEKYYDSDKNERPFNSLTYMSNEDSWWKCDKGHTFKRRIYNMNKMGCFKCSVCENLTIQKGENDLESQYPDLAKEFDIKKNKTTPQNMIINSSDPDTSWICPEGHEFRRSVASRINQFRECPVCNRTIVVKGINDYQHANPKIVDVWDFEKNDRTPDEISDRCNYKFHYKCNKGHHYACVLSTIKANDFECLVCSNKVIVPGINSLADTDFLLSKEFSSKETRKPTEFAKDSAYSPLWKCTVCNNDYHWPIRDRKPGNVNCPFCNNGYTKMGVNSLVDTDEELSREYAPDNQYDVTRTNKDSKTWAYWICPDCHRRYGAYVNERKLGDNSCPYCNNRIAIPGVNTFKVKHKDLMEEWDHINNYLLCNADQILDTYSKDVWWNCQVCNTKYIMSPKRRIYYQNRRMKSCSYCKGLRRKKKYYF